MQSAEKITHIVNHCRITQQAAAAAAAFGCPNIHGMIGNGVVVVRIMPCSFEWLKFVYAQFVSMNTSAVSISSSFFYSSLNNRLAGGLRIDIDTVTAGVRKTHAKHFSISSHCTML